MKMTKKIIAAVAALAAAAALTSCAGFGKDDFYGTWSTSYEVTSDNVNSGYSDKVGSNVDLTMYFDGKSESLFGSDPVFWQYKTRTKGSTVVKSFWAGTYKLSDNSNYTEGKLTLTYLYGKTLSGDSADTDAETLAALVTGEQDVADGKELGDYFDDDYSSEPTKDVEVFNFELGGQDFLKGYTKMTAEAVSGCTWEVTSRSFDLVSTDSALADALSILTSSSEE